MERYRMDYNSILHIHIIPFIQYGNEGFRARNNQTDNTKIVGI